MPDQIRSDPRGGLSILRSKLAQAKWPVVFRADGQFEVREPTPVPFVFARASVAASLTNGGMNYSYATSNITGALLPIEGRLVGMTISGQSALTAGTVTAKAQRLGVSVVGATIALAATEQRKTVWFGWNAGYVYLPTESFGLVLDTDAAFAPVAGVVMASLYFALQP